MASKMLKGFGQSLVFLQDQTNHIIYAVAAYDKLFLLLKCMFHFLRQQQVNLGCRAQLNGVL